MTGNKSLLALAAACAMALAACAPSPAPEASAPDASVNSPGADGAGGAE